MKIAGNSPLPKQKLPFKATLNEWQTKLEQERVDPKGLCSHKFRTSDQFSGYLGHLVDMAREVRQAGVDLPESFAITFVPQRKADRTRFNAELVLPEGTPETAKENLLNLNPGTYAVQGRTVNGKLIGMDEKLTPMPLGQALVKLNQGPRSPRYSDPSHPQYKKEKDVTVGEQLRQSLIGLRLPDKTSIQVDLV